MAIVKMKKISIYGLNSQRKAVLEYLHKKETVEICECNPEENGLDRPKTVRSISMFESYLASAEQALEILHRYIPEKTELFSKRIACDESRYNMEADEINIVNKHIYDILRADKQIKENEDSISKISLKQAQITPYMSLDIPMRFKGTLKTRAGIGTIEGQWDKIGLEIKMRESEASACYVEILNTSKQVTYIWYITPVEEYDAAMTFLKSLGYTEPSFSLSKRNTRDKYNKLEEDKQLIIKKNRELEEDIKKYSNHRNEIMLFYDHLVMRKEKYKALSHLGVTKNTFMLKGFVPEERCKELCGELEKKFHVYTMAEEPEKGEAPTAFSNNAFAAPVEQITSDYSMPSSDDIDPNPIMSIFYYMFFGMMFSDAGYGLLMMIACGILGFGNKLERKKRNTFKMFFYCGVSTTFWGIMYGSFFGDMVDTIASVFLNSSFRLTPILLNPTQKPLELLIISVAFGMLHILTALCINFYVLWRKGEKFDAVCDVGFWIAALFGICLLAGGIGGKITPLENVGKIITIVGFAGILITGGRKNKNIFGKIFGGVLSLYDITSYVGDALSYSRLMALGLATGVIASVINVLGSLGGRSVIGIIVYIVISIFGHALNFAINCLGAYVHTNRLQYVEFYQKFYEGGGKKFKPLAMNTKYYNFSKE